MPDVMRPMPRTDAKKTALDLIRFDRSGCLWYCGHSEMALHVFAYRGARFDRARVFADLNAGLIYCTEKCKSRQHPPMTVGEKERGPSAAAAAPARGHAPPAPWTFCTEWDLLPDAP